MKFFRGHFGSATNTFLLISAVYRFLTFLVLRCFCLLVVSTLLSSVVSRVSVFPVFKIIKLGKACQVRSLTKLFEEWCYCWTRNTPSWVDARVVVLGVELGCLQFGAATNTQVEWLARSPHKTSRFTLQTHSSKRLTQIHIYTYTLFHSLLLFKQTYTTSFRARAHRRQSVKRTL